MKSIILAGGSGSRLFPLSTESCPKHLLNLSSSGGLSLLQETFMRLNVFTSAKNIVTITNYKHYELAKQQLEKLNKDSVVLSEPFGRNTAPAICSVLEYFRQKNIDDDIVLIVPSDHLINDTEKFSKTVENALKYAENDYIVTFGIRPSYPETGYGYIKANANIVECFVEKPDIQTAEKYIKEGCYYWNSGMFMSKISLLLEEFRKYSPDIYSNLSLFDFTNSEELQKSVYEKMPSISIDYAVMEKSRRIALVELLSDWNDLGSFQSLYNVGIKDENGNVIKGKAVLNNVKNSYIHSTKELITLTDMENIAVIATGDIVMVCPLNKTQNIKKIYEKLNK